MPQMATYQLGDWQGAGHLPSPGPARTGGGGLFMDINTEADWRDKGEMCEKDIFKGKRIKNWVYTKTLFSSLQPCEAICDAFTVYYSALHIRGNDITSIASEEHSVWPWPPQVCSESDQKVIKKRYVSLYVCFLNTWP